MGVQPSRFSTSFAYVLDTPKPPTVPPKLPKFGGACFKAVVDMGLTGSTVQSGADPATTNLVTTNQVPGWRRIGAVTGYDTSPLIAQRTEKACWAQARAVGDARLTCGEATLTMLRSKAGMECDGEFFFEMMDGTSKKI